MEFPVACKINKSRLLWTEKQSGLQSKDAMQSMPWAGLSAVCLQWGDAMESGHRETSFKMKLQHLKFSLVMCWKALQPLGSSVTFRYHLGGEPHFRVAMTLYNCCSFWALGKTRPSVHFASSLTARSVISANKTFCWFLTFVSIRNLTRVSWVWPWAQHIFLHRTEIFEEIGVSALWLGLVSPIWHFLSLPLLLPSPAPPAIFLWKKTT